jgi:hypothetical protein
MLDPYGFGMRRKRGSSSSYDPATYFTGGTAGPWFKFSNSANVLNGSSTSATNGQTIGTVNDSGTAAINASQATDANRGVLAAAHQGGKNAISVTSAQYMDVSGLDTWLNSATSATCLCVFRPTDGSTNHSVVRQFDNGFSFDRLNALFVGLKPSIKYSKDTVDFDNLRTGATDLTAGVYHALIYKWDFTNGQTGILANNATYLAMAAAGGVTVAGAMNATNGNQSRIIRASNGFYFDMYMHKNVFMSGAQETAWFAAVKSEFTLTAY